MISGGGGQIRGKVKGPRVRGGGVTLYLVVGPLLPVADVDKVKAGLGLGETEGEILEGALAGQAAVAAHGLAETGQICINFGGDLDVAGVGAALLEDGGAEGIGGLLAAIDALGDE